MSAIFPSKFFDIVVSPCSRRMLIRHEPKSSCSPNESQSHDWIRKLAISRALEHTFVSWEECFTSMGAGNGMTTFALLHRGCRSRKSDGGGTANAAYITTFVESAIRDLEDEVGAQLLTRRARGIELTPAGRAFLEHARSVAIAG